MAALLFGVIAIIGALAARQVHAQAPEPSAALIRVLLTLDDRGRVEIDVPAGARAEAGGRALELPPGKSQLVMAERPWFLVFPEERVRRSRADPELAALASGIRVGSLSAPAAALRLRRLILADIGFMPKLERGSWLMALNNERLPEDVSRLTVEAPPGSPEGVGLGTRSYRGRVEIAFADGRLIAINTLPLEEYLYSVVGAEMPASWHIEALKAQAVAARTYAVKRLDPGAGYDLCDTAACQAYGGLETESESTRLAVDQTRGIIAVFENEPIDAVYSANTGGHSADSEDVWENPVPYLRAVPSEADAIALNSPWGARAYAWEKTITTVDLAKSLRQSGHPVIAVTEIRINGRGTGGQILELEVVAAPANLVLRRDQIRAVLGLDSTNFEVRVEPPAERTLISPSIRQARHYASSGTPLARARRSIAFDEAAPGIRLVGGSVFTRLLKSAPAIIFSGRGLGHGVGMSQWGAQGMAIAGTAYDEILRHYYTGIELVVMGAS